MTVSRLMGTRMVGGFVRGDGAFLAHTRISNTAYIFARDQLEIADHVFIGHFAVLDATYGLRIGEGCQIGFFTGIFTHSSHAAIRLYGREYVHTPSKKAYFTAPVEIGEYAFIVRMPRCCLAPESAGVALFPRIAWSWQTSRLCHLGRAACPDHRGHASDGRPPTGKAPGTRRTLPRLGG
ncbi:MAG: hypothetical protein R3E52_14270 [Burkholderiaceae bacterium]